MMVRKTMILLLFCFITSGLSDWPVAQAFFCLTKVEVPSKLVSVKSIRNNSFRRNIPDKTAELRGGDVRTASYRAAHLCRSIRIFYVHSTERDGCIVKSVKEKNLKKQTGEQILEQAKDNLHGLAKTLRQIRQTEIEVIHACCDVLLGCRDYLCDDFVGWLKETRGIEIDQDGSIYSGGKTKSPEDEERKNLLDEITTILSARSTVMLEQVLGVLKNTKSDTIKISA